MIRTVPPQRERHHGKEHGKGAQHVDGPEAAAVTVPIMDCTRVRSADAHRQVDWIRGSKRGGGRGSGGGGGSSGACRAAATSAPPGETPHGSIIMGQSGIFISDLEDGVPRPPLAAIAVVDQPVTGRR